MIWENYSKPLQKKEFRKKEIVHKQYLRYEEAELIYGISHPLIRRIAEKAGAILRVNAVLTLIDRERFDEYFEKYRQPSTIGWREDQKE